MSATAHPPSYNTRSCPVCVHPQKAIIEGQMQAGFAPHLTARMFELTERVLKEHRERHLNAVTVYSAVTADDLVTGVQDVMDTLRMRIRLRSQAEPDNDKKLTALMTVYLQGIALMAKLTGASLRPDPLAAIPLWGRLLEGIRKALEPFPEAREAVEDAIAKIQAEVG